MTTQNYCLVDQATNICDNVVVWDGNPDTWQPPADHLTLIQATTPAKVWYWNGTYLITNEPQPAPISTIPVTTA